MVTHRTFLTVHPNDAEGTREAVLTDLLAMRQQSKHKCADKIIKMIEDLRLNGLECRYIKTFKDSSIFELKDRTPDGGARAYCFRVSKDDFAVARAECKKENAADKTLLRWTENVIAAWQEGEEVLRPKLKKETKEAKPKEKKRKDIPIVKSKRSLPKGDGWTGQDISEAVEEMLITEAVGEALQTARKTRKLTGTELGKRLGVGRSRISQLEHKESEYDLSTLYRVFDALGYDLELRIVPRGKGKAIKVVR